MLGEMETGISKLSWDKSVKTQVIAKISKQEKQSETFTLLLKTNYSSEKQWNKQL